jgi:transcriptional regulator with XRE-family HTH domain
MRVMRSNDLQERRAALRLTQKTVEDQTGVQQSVLSNWEAGRIPIAVRHAMRLAKCYGTSVEELFAFVDDEAGAPSGEHRATGTHG